MEDSEETPIQRQARLRREKREKKILSGASSRLDKITSLSGGRPAETSAPTPATSTQPQFRPSSAPQASPKPANPTTSEPTQADLEASMRELLRAPIPAPAAPPPSRAQPPPPADETQDPMLALLQQMMSGSLPREDGAGQSDGGPAPFDGLPPGLAAMLGGGFASGDNATAGAAPAAKSVYAWKIAHALFSLCLGVYILYTYTFSGTLSARMRFGGGVVDSDTIASIFWVFVTAELGLQGARYLLEGGAVEEGMVKNLAGFLPQPWRRRIELGSRYVGIWSTIVQDAFVVVFLLGVVAWWRG